MSRMFDIEGIGKVIFVEDPGEFALKIQLEDMKLERDIKFFSQDLLKGFFVDIDEENAKQMAVATIKNNIEESITHMHR